MPFYVILKPALIIREKEGRRPGTSAAWRANDPLKRPSCALVVAFGMALLHNADRALLSTLLSIRFPFSFSPLSLHTSDTLPLSMKHRVSVAVIGAGVVEYHT